MKRVILAALFAISGMLAASSDTNSSDTDSSDTNTERRKVFSLVSTRIYVDRDGNAKTPMTLTGLYFNGECYYGPYETIVTCETANDFLRFNSDVAKTLEAKIRAFFNTAKEEAEKAFSLFEDVKDLDKKQFIDAFVNVYFQRNCEKKHRQFD